MQGVEEPPPNAPPTTGQSAEESAWSDSVPLPQSMGDLVGDVREHQPVIWPKAIGLALLHVVALYGLIARAREAMLPTWIFTAIYGTGAGIGNTAGLHRLWTHRSYSAKLPLRILLAILYCMAGMTPLHKWVKDHRIHHKFSETSADPHNANRGFFFAHVGWLMVKPHSAVEKYGSKIDMSDIEADPVVRFFDKYYGVIMIAMTFVIPTLIPIYFWGENWQIATLAMLVRYAWILNAAFSVNSFAHMWGNRPYNKNLKPTENALVSLFAFGEGWHNYHHVFPWDYKAAEVPYFFNPSTVFIHIMALLGLAYDLKTPSRELIEKVSANKGDGSAVGQWSSQEGKEQ